MNDLLTAALGYAARGWHVHPVGGGREGKLPLTEHGQLDATTDVRQIEEWWRVNPQANVGIHCRPSGLYVVDVDSKPGKVGGDSYAALAVRYGHVETYTVRTHSGGWHYYYAVPLDCELQNSAGRLGPDIDTRGNGFVVAPPSVTPIGIYQVAVPANVAPLPQWIAELIATRPPAHTQPQPLDRSNESRVITQNGNNGHELLAAPDNTFTLAEARAFVASALERLRSTREGHGFNDALMRAAAAHAQFIPGVWSEEEVWRTLDAALRVQFPAGMNHEDVRTIQSGLRMGANDPKAVLRQPFPAPVDESIVVAAAAQEAAAAESNAMTLASHLALAERFAQRFAGDLRYVHRVGWHVWVGAHWAEDERNEVFRFYHQFMWERLATAERLNLDPATQLVGEALERQVRGNCTLAAVQGVTKLAAALWPLSTAVSDCDRSPELFNTPVGTFDLNAGHLRAHDRNDMITKCAGAGPDPYMDAAPWLMFLARILPDPEVRGFVQRLIGSAMFGAQHEHLLPIWHGVGANGKSVLMNVITRLFGNYCVHLPADALLSHTHSPHPTILMPLRGARLAFASETDDGRRFNAALVKRLTGGDPITARRMRQDDITWQPTHQLIMVTNYPPAVETHDQAMWRRVAIVPFDVVIPVAERDPYLTEKLMACLPAVAAWAWNGWLEYRSRGLAIPDAVRARTEAFRADSDALGRFIEERCRTGAMCSASLGDLYAAWGAWARDSGEESGGIVELSKALESRGFVKRKKVGVMWFGGIMVNPVAQVIAL